MDSYLQNIMRSFRKANFDVRKKPLRHMYPNTPKPAGSNIYDVFKSKNYDPYNITTFDIAQYVSIKNRTTKDIVHVTFGTYSVN